MNRSRVLMLCALTFASPVMAASLTGCCKKQLEEVKKKNEAEQKQRITDIKAYYKDLATVAAAVKPAGQLSLEKCDEAVIASKKKHSFGGRLLTVDHEFLSLLTGPTEDKAKRKELAAWEWVRSQEIQRMKHPDAIGGDSTVARFVMEDIEKAKKLPLLGVVRTEKRAMPIVPEGTDDFVGGVYQGWIVVVDQQTKKPLCQAPFKVRNSEEIKYKEGRFSSEVERARAAAKEDFRENFEAGTNAALKKISSHLRVNLGLFQL